VVGLKGTFVKIQSNGAECANRQEIKDIRHGTKHTSQIHNENLGDKDDTPSSPWKSCKISTKIQNQITDVE
jgi:hypothetical protein